MITACMSTVPWRLQALEQMLPTILPQVDQLNVYLQGYDAVPECLRHDNIHTVDGRQHPKWDALKSTCKLFWIAQGLVDDGIHLTVDDDMLYPPDYVQRCSSAIDRYGSRVVVGFHGAIYKPDVRHLYRDRQTFHFKDAFEADTPVHTLGTGTTSWHTSALRIDDLLDWDGVDWAVAIAAQRQSVPMVCLARPAGYLTALPEAYDTRSCSELDSYLERMAGFYHSHPNWTVHKPSTGRREVVVVMPCYREQVDRIMRSVDSAISVPNVDRVLVVDDASPDPIVLPYRDRLSVIRREVNGGPSPAMNTGIRTLADNAIICRLDVGDTYHPAAKARQIDEVLSGRHRAVCSWHYDPVRHFTRTLDRGWQRGLFQDNQFASTTLVMERSVWDEVGGYSDTLRWTDDWRFAAIVQFYVGWHEFPEVTGEHGMWPGGHSDVEGKPEKKIARDRDMAETRRLCLALGNPSAHAHLFNERWCKKRGLAPLKMPGKK